MIWILASITEALAFTEESDSTRSTYIHSYSDYFFIGPLIEKDNLDFDIISTKDNRMKYAFKTNISYSIGVNVNLFDVNLRFSFSTPLATESEFIYGKSDVKDLQLTAITRRWFADVFYQKYDGFYVESENQIPVGQPFPQRADIDTRNYGASFAYIFKSDQFSLRAPYIFSERQKVSKGSFLVSSVLSSFSMQADSALIPADKRNTWGAGSNVNELHFISLGLGPGYSHTFVLENFFLNLTLAIGPAHYWVRHKEQGKPDVYDIRIDTYSLGRIALGYNGDRFFAGLSITAQARNIRYEQTTLQNGSGTFRLVTGYRFKEVGHLKRKATDLITGKP